MNKRFLHISVIFLLVLLAFIQSSHFSVQAKTSEEIEEEMKELEEEQKRLEKEHDELDRKQGDVEQEKNETSNRIDENLEEQSDTQNELDQLDESLSETENDITTTETEISSLQNEMDELTSNVKNIEDDITKLHKDIKQMNGEIDDLEEDIAKREELLKDRLRSMQNNGGGVVKYLEVLLGAKNFTDLISRTTTVTSIMQQDETMITEHQEDKEALETKRVAVEEKSDELKENKEELVAKKSEVKQHKGIIEGEKQELIALQQDLDEQMEEKDRLLVQLSEEQEYLEEYELSLEEEQEILAAQGPALEQAQQLAEQEQAELSQLADEKEEEDGGEEVPPPSGDQIFIKPAGGTYTSPYGWRNDPINGGKNFHHGVDIGSHSGTDLKAAATGVVSIARGMGGYGNFIMITHHINSQSYATVYAHLSKIDVVPGQEVQQGELIGKTGNTGRSTGPHLHFEVHLNEWKSDRSNSTNPRPYLIN